MLAGYHANGPSGSMGSSRDIPTDLSVFGFCGHLNRGVTTMKKVCMVLCVLGVLGLSVVSTGCGGSSPTTKKDSGK
jgi:hypothetical protein